MKVFLHIGSHKTGTTAIQSVASRNPALLRQQGLLYPSYDLIGGTREQSHLRTVDRLLRGPEADSPNQPARLLAQARQVAEDAGLNILLSAESLFRLPAARVEDLGRTLRDAFAGAAFVVVCSLRPRAEFAESIYRNGYRVYKTVPAPFAQWLGTSRGLFDYEAILDRHAAALQAERLVLPYSRESRAGFVHTFFRALNVSLPDDAIPANKNPSLGPVECLAKRIVMAGGCDPDLSRRFNKFAARHPVPDAAGYGFLDRHAEQGLLSRFLDSDARMISAYPELASVLGPSVPLLDADPLDDRADSLAQAMASRFTGTL